MYAPKGGIKSAPRSEVSARAVKVSSGEPPDPSLTCMGRLRRENLTREQHQQPGKCKRGNSLALIKNDEFLFICKFCDFQINNMTKNIITVVIDIALHIEQSNYIKICTWQKWPHMHMQYCILSDITIECCNLIIEYYDNNIIILNFSFARSAYCVLFSNFFGFWRIPHHVAIIYWYL